MRSNFTRSVRTPGRVGLFRCNVCQEPLASDQALREHYQKCHPEAAAEIERLQARLSGKEASHPTH